MRVDVLLETFGTGWAEVRDGAVDAEQAGFDGVWLNDHLAGAVQGAPHVLECWTVLSALAERVPRLTIGPLVLNVANRDPGTLAVMAATLQQVSEGRLVLGLGAGARTGTAWAIEQEALGRRVPGDAEQRHSVETAVAVLRQVWSGEVPLAAGFLRPEPLPPIVIAASGQDRWPRRPSGRRDLRTGRADDTGTACRRPWRLYRGWPGPGTSAGRPPYLQLREVPLCTRLTLWKFVRMRGCSACSTFGLDGLRPRTRSL